jgi:4-amino-4-deoxy-L-arabinose transferase-like glycosyltransferase
MTLARWAYLLLIVSTCWLFLWNLGASSISLRSDEVIYVRVTQSILHNGDIFPLMHGGVPTYEKPPLKLWLGTLAPLLLGESNFSFRVLDAALGVAVVLLTVNLMRAISGSLWLGIVSGVLLLGMPELVISHHGFRRAVLDGLLSFVTMLVAYGTWQMIELRSSGTPQRALTRRAIGVGLLCSVAVLTKSVAGAVPALCAVAVWLITAPSGGGSVMKRLVHDRSWLWILALPGLTFIGYCAALWWCVGPKALSIFVGVEILTRTLSGFEGHNTSQSWFYLWSLFIRGATVPRVLLMVGLCGALVSMRKERGVRFLLVWGCLPVILYSLAASKVPWYLNPFLPFISMVAVAGTAQLVARVHARWGRGGARYVVAFVVLAALPAYSRAVIRNVETVAESSDRIALDTLVESLRGEYSQFVILDKSLSGWTNPRRGRFNVEGIYREMLKPGLRTVPTISEFTPQPGEVVIVREESLVELPVGWRELGRAPPFASRTWGVVAVVYEVVNG